MVGLPRVEQI
jgi:hypothetical protein